MFARRLAAVFLGLGLVVLAVPPRATGQAGGTSDEVRFRNPKKDHQEETVRGVAKETVGGIKVEAGGKTLAEIPASQIVSVTYGTLPGLDNSTLNKLKAAESKDPAAKVRGDYAEALKANPADPKTKRYLEYRETIWALRTADSKTGEAFKPEAEAAVAKLSAFAREYAKKNAWEAWPTAEAAARLQLELGKHNDAANTYSFLSKVEGLPPELKFLARLGEVEMLFRSGNALSAAPAVDELAKTTGFPTTGPIKERLLILQAVIKASADKKPKTKPADAVKVIEDLLAKTTDSSVRGFGHNLLGELYLQCDLPRDAMWELLRVEVVDNQDRDEVVKAVVRLAEAFAKQGMDDRAKTYRDKLPSIKGV